MHRTGEFPGYEHLQAWAALLGWNDLQPHEHVVPADDPTPAAGAVIVWYESGTPDDITLQFNVAPSHRAAVFALRYRLFSHWHPFELYDDPASQHAEAERLTDSLHHRWFATRAARRAYRLQHPECAGYSWRRLRAEVSSHRES